MISEGTISEGTVSGTTAPETTAPEGMIYECPQCHLPQEAGNTACPHCRAQFDGPVPSDAVIPKEDTAVKAEAEPIPAAPPEAAQGPMPLDGGMPQTDAKPLPSAEPQPYLTPPSYTPPAYSPPLYTPPPAPAPMNAPLGGPTKALLIALPIVLVLVLGGVYFASTLNTGTPASVTPAVVNAPMPIPSAPAPVGSPLALQGEANRTNAGGDPRAQMLVGRWEAKSGDFYIFKGDGTGSRGALTQQQKVQTFLWGLVQNRLMLYMDKTEMLRFNPGTDDDTVFIAAQNGHYIQYSRKKT